MSGGGGVYVPGTADRYCFCFKKAFFDLHNNSTRLRNSNARPRVGGSTTGRRNSLGSPPCPPSTRLTCSLPKPSSWSSLTSFLSHAGMSPHPPPAPLSPSLFPTGPQYPAGGPRSTDVICAALGMVGRSCTTGWMPHTSDYSSTPPRPTRFVTLPPRTRHLYVP